MANFFLINPKYLIHPIRSIIQTLLMVKVGQYRHHSCLFFALFNEIYRKNRGIRTRITRVEGKLVDHLTTTMVQLKKLKIPIKLKPKFRRKGQKAVPLVQRHCSNSPNLMTRVWTDQELLEKGLMVHLLASLS